MQQESASILDFDEVYNRYFDAVVRYLTGIVGMNDATDIAQETFVKVHTQLSSLKDPAKISSWVYMIALNTARDSLRKNTIKTGDDTANIIRENATDSHDMELFRDTRGRTPDERIIRQEMIECYVNFVEQLPGDYYSVYVLSQFEGLSNGDIAKSLSLSLDTVKIRLHRARTQLHESLRTHCQAYHDEHGELQAAPREK